MFAKHNRTGFTLIETMIAMGVLAFGMLGLMNMVVVAARNTGTAGHRTQAVELARDLVESMAGWDFTDVRLSNVLTNNDGVCVHGTGTGSTVCTVPRQMVNFPVPSARSYLVGGTDVDHANAELTSGYTGLALPLGFERYWNVWPADVNVNGITDSLTIAVVVRFWRNGTAEDVVMTTTKTNNVEVVTAGIP